MAIAYFLKVTGGPGESPSSAHKNEIEVLSWSWGGHQSASMGGGGLAAGKVQMADFNLTKAVDKSSPKLLSFLCVGQHIDQVILTAQKSGAGKTPADYLTITMTDAMVTSFQLGGSQHEEIGQESVSLAYAKIVLDYKIQAKDGSLSAGGTASYDIKLQEGST